MSSSPITERASPRMVVTTRWVGGCATRADRGLLPSDDGSAKPRYSSSKRVPSFLPRYLLPRRVREWRRVWLEELRKRRGTPCSTSPRAWPYGRDGRSEE